jgi:acyl-CoA dehydrogenase
MIELFIQSPPQLGNQYTDDVFLQSYLRRVLPTTVMQDIEPELHEMGGLAGDDLYQLQLADRLNEPRLTQWDAWGNRIDRVELTPLWQHAARVACEYGLVAIPYEREHGRYSRLHQFALLYLFHPSSDVYTCPLAMSDGAARTLLKSDNQALIKRAVNKLTSRDVNHAWTSGQWMTESSGGSDVGSASTKAVRQKDGTWRLYGKKWFTSAVTSQMALTLARPEGDEAGGGNLALFYLETRDAAELLNGIRVERLKDKLGTRKVPTAELTLEGSFAELVGTTQEGTHAIEPMLVVTRAWNSISAAAFMRRGLALAQSYAQQRTAFGKRLAELPLHAQTLAELEAETHGALLLTLELVQLLGREESDAIDDQQRALLRLLTPIAKLTTGKQAVAVLSEVVESFGGAGYVEDTSIPMLLRDAQVLPIWEGTTNVLALDALLRSDVQAGLAALLARVNAGIETVQNDKLVLCGKTAKNALEQAKQWLASTQDKAALQAGARRFALTLGRSFELALLVEHAQWQLDQGAGVDVIDAAVCFSRTSIDLL